ncbi:MAG TPA: peptide chain release factor N(5)-glutamine methyltransferase [Chthoniobacterales bacterium]|nr:peptide chain release factor N(5)-glutamine methyltransferase [Chthoniobacterales bacterium]
MPITYYSSSIALRITVTVLQVLQNTADFFARKGIESPRLNIEHLLADTLGKRRIDLYLEFDRTLSEEELAPLREKVRRRVEGEPLQYLLGSWDFYGRSFQTDQRALIPRPETEVLVEIGLKAIRARPTRHHRLLDIGTGSGILAITFALECPNLEVVGSDISPPALNLARENARRHGLDDRIEWVESDLLGSVTGTFDFVVANLPYISTEELPKLAPEVRYDPRLALDGGPEGLAVIRRAVEELPSALTDGAFMILEVGFDQADRVTDLMTAQKFRDISVENDYQGVRRFVTAWYG